MSDATREEAIKWCIDNKVDFVSPLFPPPNGWIWYETRGVMWHTLSGVFANIEEEDIEWTEVIARVVSVYC